MNDYLTIAEIQSKAAAERYALALSTAAAAQERIAALEEALKDAEWLRLQAESLAMTVTYPEEFGRVRHIGTEPPPDDITALIDLSTGTAWDRAVARSNSRLWNLAQDFQAIANTAVDPTIAEVWRKASDLARDAYNTKTEG